MLTPNPENLRIGAGNVFIGQWALNDALERIFSGRHVGNVSSAAINNEVTEIEKLSAMEGARGLYASDVTGVKSKLAATLDELDRENIALAMLSTPKAFTQDSDTATDKEINNGEAIELDTWYSLGGDPCVNPTVTSVSQGGALDPETDYEINAPAGLIRILSSGAGTAAVTTWTGTIPGLSGKQIMGLDTPKIVVAVRITDAVDMVRGIKGQLDIWKVSMKPNGDIQFIGEEYASLVMSGAILADTTRPAGERYYRWLPISELEETGS